MTDFLSEISSGISDQQEALNITFNTKTNKHQPIHFYIL